MTAVERALRELGREAAFPPTPALPETRLAHAPARRPRRAGAAAVALAAAALAAVALSPGARTAIVDLFAAVPGVRVERAPELPPVPAGPFAGSGRAVSPAEAERLAGFDVRLPATLGDPDRVLFARDGGADAVTAVYGLDGGSAQAVLTQWRAHVVLFRKLLGVGAHARLLRVGGDRGLWIAGPEHAVFYRPEAGAPERRLPPFLAGNTLIWSRGGVAYRLEANVMLADALRIAASVR